MKKKIAVMAVMLCTALLEQPVQARIHPIKIAWYSIREKKSQQIRQN